MVTPALGYVRCKKKICYQIFMCYDLFMCYAYLPPFCCKLRQHTLLMLRTFQYLATPSDITPY